MALAAIGAIRMAILIRTSDVPPWPTRPPSWGVVQTHRWRPAPAGPDPAGPGRAPPPPAPARPRAGGGGQPPGGRPAPAGPDPAGPDPADDVSAWCGVG